MGMISGGVWIEGRRVELAPSDPERPPPPWRELDRAHRFLRRARAAAERLARTEEWPVRITPVRYLLLARLREATRFGIRPSRLARSLRLGRSSVSHHLRVLEEGGLVRRTPRFGSARTVAVRLTEEGLARLWRLAPAMDPGRLGWEPARNGGEAPGEASETVPGAGAAPAERADAGDGWQAPPRLDPDASLRSFPSGVADTTSNRNHMGVPFLDLKLQYESLRADIDAAVARVVESQRFVLGPEVEGLEAELAELVGGGEAVGCASGTDALLLVLEALEPSDGDEAVVPAFTFFATAGAAWNAGFRPVFCDVDPDTFNVTGETVEAAITDRTRALIPVHLYGQMAPLEDLELLLVERPELFLLEDCAQALGAARLLADGEVAAGGAGRLAPGGHAGAFSFFPTKNVGAFGDGGMITTGDPELADRLRKLRVHGGRQMYHHEMVGTNSRLDALQAAVLRVKLPHLDRWNRARRAHAAIYDEMLSDLEEVTTPTVLAGNVHTYNQYTLRVTARDELREFLTDREIGSGLYYPVPLHLQECFRELGYRRGDFPVSERLCEEVVSLPVFPELGRERAREVAEAIREFYGD